MRKWFLFAALTLSASVAAQSGPSQNAQCLDEAKIFGVAGSFRDSGYSPENALKAINKDAPDFPLERKKKIINAVYFDQAFQRINVHAAVSSGVIYQRCMEGWKQKYQPLK